MRLLSENSTKVEEDICTFLDANIVADWDTLNLITTILSEYLIIDA